ncbi:MAG: hypothetical protein LBV21_00530, partial [Candidatus Adiutrix sp.]|nr:hypothetical protein [Candidatus Adiutrix sp.]
MTTWSKIFGVAVCLALLSPSWLQTGGLDGDPAPLEIIDALGRPVRLIKPPRRVVAVFSSNAEIVAALGYADLIVGIDALTFHPPEIRDCPKIGGRL